MKKYLAILVIFLLAGCRGNQKQGTVSDSGEGPVGKDSNYIQAEQKDDHSPGLQTDPTAENQPNQNQPPDQKTGQQPETGSQPDQPKADDPNTPAEIYPGDKHNLNDTALEKPRIVYGAKNKTVSTSAKLKLYSGNKGSLSDTAAEAPIPH